MRRANSESSAWSRTEIPVVDWLDARKDKVLAWRFGPLSIDTAIVVVLPVVVLLLWGAQQWVPPNSPDSEFYYSLGLHGSDVTDRAPFPAYYWTRIGLIGPVHVLTQMFGTAAGYTLWRILLLVITVLPFYLILTRRYGRAAGGAGVLIVATNSLIIASLADTYTNSAGVAAFSALTGFGCLAVTASSQRTALLASIAAGAAAGWIPMINLGAGGPLAATMLALSAAMIWRRRFRAVGPLLFAAVSAIAVFALFFGAGRLMFPNLDWVTTTTEALANVSIAAFHEATLNWLWYQPALLIPVVALVAAVTVLALHPLARRTELPVAAAVLACVLAVSAYQQTLGQGSFLQRAYFYSWLWPAVLLALVTALVGMTATRGQRWILLAGAATVVPLCGHSRWTFTVPPIGLLLAVCVCVAVAFTARRWAVQPKWAGGALVLVGCLSVVQLLQVGAPGDSPVASRDQGAVGAYQSAGYEQLYRLDEQVEEWVLSNTSDTDRIKGWYEEGPVASSVAPMSLMPFFSLGRPTLSPEMIADMEIVGYTYLLAVASDQAGIDVLEASIPKNLSDGKQPRKCQRFQEDPYAVSVCLLPLKPVRR